MRLDVDRVGSADFKGHENVFFCLLVKTSLLPRCDIYKVEKKIAILSFPTGITESILPHHELGPWVVLTRTKRWCGLNADSRAAGMMGGNGCGWCPEVMFSHAP